MSTASPQLYRPAGKHTVRPIDSPPVITLQETAKHKYFTYLSSQRQRLIRERPEANPAGFVCAKRSPSHRSLLLNHLRLQEEYGKNIWYGQNNPCFQVTANEIVLYLTFHPAVMLTG